MTLILLLLLLQTLEPCPAGTERRYDTKTNDLVCGTGEPSQRFQRLVVSSATVSVDCLMAMRDAIRKVRASYVPREPGTIIGFGTHWTYGSIFANGQDECGCPIAGISDDSSPECLRCRADKAEAKMKAQHKVWAAREAAEKALDLVDKICEGIE